MKENNKFKLRLQADIALIEAKLIRFKVRGMGFTAEAKDRHEEHVEELEQKIDGINHRLCDFEKADEHLGGDSRISIEKSLQELQAVLLYVTQTFKTEPGVSDIHGNDDDPFPYKEGLNELTTDKKSKILNRRKIMGDKGGKKNKAKNQKQSKEKQKQKQANKHVKQPKVSPFSGTNL